MVILIAKEKVFFLGVERRTKAKTTKLFFLLHSPENITISHFLDKKKEKKQREKTVFMVLEILTSKKNTSAMSNVKKQEKKLFCCYFFQRWRPFFLFCLSMWVLNLSEIFFQADVFFPSSCTSCLFLLQSVSWRRKRKINKILI